MTDLTALLSAALADGWTITFTAEHHAALPYGCHVSRTIETIANTIYRRAVGNAAGPDAYTALDRALTFAEIDEANTVHIHTSTAASTDTPDLLSALGIALPAAFTRDPTCHPRRPSR